MGHDSSKVLMGSTQSSIKEVANHKGTVEAGLAVRLKDDNTLATATGSGVGGLLGVSVGKDLSDIGRTAIARKGLRVPVKLASGVTPAIGGAVYIVNATGEAHTSSDAARTLVNAVYASAKITGIGEDGLSKDVALIDFPGGL
jgi:hypothetical protein